MRASIRRRASRSTAPPARPCVRHSPLPLRRTPARTSRSGIAASIMRPRRREALAARIVRALSLMMNKTCFEKNFRARAESYAHRLVQCNDILQSKLRISGPVVHSLAVRNNLKTRGSKDNFKCSRRATIRTAAVTGDNFPCSRRATIRIAAVTSDRFPCSRRATIRIAAVTSDNFQGSRRATIRIAAVTSKNFQGSRRATIRTATLSSDP